MSKASGVVELSRTAPHRRSSCRAVRAWLIVRQTTAGRACLLGVGLSYMSRMRWASRVPLVHRRAGRWWTEGVQGLQDRSSRPRTMPHRTAAGGDRYAYWAALARWGRRGSATVEMRATSGGLGATATASFRNSSWCGNWRPTCTSLPKPSRFTGRDVHSVGSGSSRRCATPAGRDPDHRQRLRSSTRKFVCFVRDESISAVPGTSLVPPGQADGSGATVGEAEE
ncbi:leucine zipper domain-containing protein [Streptomyces sp. NPDC052287]|uniref:leucine zipper domain-containing protein n=1 Tax=Streptomyces sp. NPDC052287 TaxID=3154950 RepID=UPI00344A6A68